MVFKLVSRGALFGLVCWSSVSLACDPNESCNRCLAHNPINGNCIADGNDPICEARKASCPVLDNLPGSPTGPGGPFAPGGPFGGLTVEQARDCLANLAACPGSVFARLGYQAVRPAVNAYISFLRTQAEGRWRTLSPGFINQVQPFFQSDLRTVRYAVEISTIHGQAITIGNDIFFPEDVKENPDAGLFYHELEHVDQYRRKGGIESFMTEYVMKSTGSVFHGGNSVNMHDSIDLENEAIQKARQVLDALTPDDGGAIVTASRFCHARTKTCIVPEPQPPGTPCVCAGRFSMVSGTIE